MSNKAKNKSSGNSSTPESTIFTTPENNHFHSKRLYIPLDPIRQEIRLIRVYPRRIRGTDLPNVFPRWIIPGTDANRLVRETPIKPQILDQSAANAIALPQWRSRTSSEACKRLLRPLPPGWWAASYNKHMKKYRYVGQSNISLPSALLPDILYFVNCYTGESQWELPTEQPPEAPSATPETFIACEMTNQVPLTTMTGRYSALSYCAGSSSKASKIMINGMWFNAFANLEHSLDCFREHVSRSQGMRSELLIWTDQVCINQKDHVEKSHQVAFMRQIYHQAEQVFVCLSTASTTPAQLRSAPDGTAFLRSILEQEFRSASPALGITPTQMSLLHQMFEEVQNEPGLLRVKTWCDFSRNLILEPWWTRAWVYQEFLVASRAYFLYGQICISWLELAPFLTLFCSTLSKDSGMESLRSRVSDNQASIQFSPLQSQLPIEETKRPKEEEFNSSLETEAFLANLRTVLDNTEAFRARVSYFVKSKTEWTGTLNLHKLLQNASFFKSSDPRDLVYAFIGLTGPSEAIRPEYNNENSIRHVLITAAERILESEGNLSMLDDALTHGRSGDRMSLPSWIPDYTSSINTAAETTEELITGRGKEHQASKTARSEAVVMRYGQDHASARLNTPGMYVGTLAEIVSDSYSWSFIFMTSSGIKAMTTSAARVGDKLWVLLGGRTVYVLRKQNEEDYCLISAASLYKNTVNGDWVPSNIMYGELVDQRDQGKAKPQFISII